jgi:hypothetical protein
MLVPAALGAYLKLLDPLAYRQFGGPEIGGDASRTVGLVLGPTPNRRCGCLDSNFTLKVVQTFAVYKTLNAVTTRARRSGDQNQNPGGSSAAAMPGLAGELQEH